MACTGHEIICDCDDDADPDQEMILALETIEIIASDCHAGYMKADVALEKIRFAALEARANASKRRKEG